MTNDFKRGFAEGSVSNGLPWTPYFRNGTKGMIKPKTAQNGFSTMSDERKGTVTSLAMRGYNIGKIPELTAYVFFPFNNNIIDYCGNYGYSIDYVKSSAGDFDRWIFLKNEFNEPDNTGEVGDVETEYKTTYGDLTIENGSAHFGGNTGIRIHNKYQYSNFSWVCDMCFKCNFCAEELKNDGGVFQDDDGYYRWEERGSFLFGFSFVGKTWSESTNKTFLEIYISKKGVCLVINRPTIPLEENTYKLLYYEMDIEIGKQYGIKVNYPKGRNYGDMACVTVELDGKTIITSEEVNLGVNSGLLSMCIGHSAIYPKDGSGIKGEGIYDDGFVGRMESFIWEA